MSEMLHLLLTTLGIASSIDVTTLGGVTAVAAALALMTAAVVIALVATNDPASAAASPPHPRRAIDRSAPLAQSDPDAPGHARPRAPQFVAPAT